MHSPLRQSVLWSDYIRTYSNTGFIRNKSLSASPNKVVLITAMTEWIFKIKIHIMLALGLRMRGWRPIVLTERYHQWTHRYFRAFGIDEFVYHQDIDIEEHERLRIDEESKRLLQQPLSLPAIKEWTYRGAFIGASVLRTVVKMSPYGVPDFDDPRIYSALREAIPTVLERVHRMEALLKDHAPALILVNELNTDWSGPWAEISATDGLNIIFHNQIQDNKLIFRRLTKETWNQNPYSLSNQELDLISSRDWGGKDKELDDEFCNRYAGQLVMEALNHPGVQEKSRDEIIQKLSLDPGKKIAVIFSHILWDTNLFSGKELFNSYSDWFVESLRAAKTNDRINWVIKLHPANIWRRARSKNREELAELKLIKEYIGELPSHIRVLHPDTDISPLSLYRVINYGITVRGTAGTELPCFGVPVITAGKGPYSGLGFTVDPSSREEYLDTLVNIHKLGRLPDEQVLRAKWHAYGLFKVRPWKMKSFRMSLNLRKHGMHILDHNLDLNASSWDEIYRNGDLQKWADWAEAGKNLDYMEHVA